MDSKVATTNVSISTNFSKNYCSEDDKLYIEDKTGLLLNNKIYIELISCFKKINVFLLLKKL